MSRREEASKLNSENIVRRKGSGHCRCPPAKIMAKDIYLFASGSLAAAAFSVTQGGTMKSFVAKDVDSAMDSLQINIADTKTVLDKMWLFERYVLL